MTRRSAREGALAISPGSSTDRHRTAMARLEAASVGLVADVLDPSDDRSFYELAAIRLIDAALGDLRGAELIDSGISDLKTTA
jgi:hypothetical protein